MNSVQYAPQGSTGTLVQSIGWIDFGPNFVLNPSAEPVLVQNTIPGGFTLQFRISMTASISSPAVGSIPAFTAATSPTFPRAPFGVVQYQNIPGNVSLTLQTNPDIQDVLNYQIQITDIQVMDSAMKPVKDYTMYISDSGVTRKGSTDIFELWQATTNGSPFRITNQLPSYNNTLTGPVIAGEGTTTITETGTDTSTSDTDSYLYSTRKPSTLSLVTRVNGGTESFTLGIILNGDREALLTSGSDYICEHGLRGTMSKTYISYPDKRIVSIQYGSNKYQIYNNPVFITGAFATYIVFADRILTVPFSYAARTGVNEDLFIIQTYSSYGESGKYYVSFHYHLPRGSRPQDAPDGGAPVPPGPDFNTPGSGSDRRPDFGQNGGCDRRPSHGHGGCDCIR